MGAPLTSHEAQLMQPMRTSGAKLPPRSRRGTRQTCSEGMKNSTAEHIPHGKAMGRRGLTLFVPKLVERVDIARREHTNLNAQR